MHLVVLQTCNVFRNSHCIPVQIVTLIQSDTIKVFSFLINIIVLTQTTLHNEIDITKLHIKTHTISYSVNTVCDLENDCLLVLVYLWFQSRQIVHKVHEWTPGFLESPYSTTESTRNACCEHIEEKWTQDMAISHCRGVTTVHNFIINHWYSSLTMHLSSECFNDIEQFKSSISLYFRSLQWSLSSLL